MCFATHSGCMGGEIWISRLENGYSVEMRFYQEG
jgi:hypothetical protein